MNRSFFNVMLGGFGTESGRLPHQPASRKATFVPSDAENAAAMLQQAKR
jgi:NAD/NADP transhydrogenase beta subunit